MTTPDDDVIVDRDPDDLTSPHQPSGQLDIVPARLELTAWVVVKEQDRGGAVVQGSPKEIGGVDGRLGAGSETEFVASDQAVPPVDTQNPENLAALHLQPAQQIFAHDCRVAEDLRFSQPCPGDPVAEFETGENRRRLGRPDPVDAQKLGGFPASELRQAAGCDQEGIGLDNRSPSSPAGPHQDRQQLRIRKNRRTVFEQPFTRP